MNRPAASSIFPCESSETILYYKGLVPPPFCAGRPVFRRISGACGNRGVHPARDWNEGKGAERFPNV